MNLDQGLDEPVHDGPWVRGEKVKYWSALVSSENNQMQTQRAGIGVPPFLP